MTAENPSRNAYRKVALRNDLDRLLETAKQVRKDFESGNSDAESYDVFNSLLNSRPDLTLQSDARRIDILQEYVETDLADFTDSLDTYTGKEAMVEAVGFDTVRNTAAKLESEIEELYRDLSTPQDLR